MTGAVVCMMQLGTWAHGHEYATHKEGDVGNFLIKVLILPILLRHMSKREICGPPDF